MKDKDTIIAEQAETIAEQKVVIAELTKTVQTLLQRIEELQDEVARLKKDSNNSSRPPSSDIVKPKINVQKRTVKKRKRGGQPGHRKCTRRPFAADDTDNVIEYEFRGKDLDGLIALDDWHVVQQATLPEKGFARRMKHIQSGFLNQVRKPPGHKLAETLTQRFKGQSAETYFRFLTEPNVEPTNNGTEREIRHTVIDRRITQGTRGNAGMRWSERIWTAIATCKKQNKNVFDFIHKSLLAHWTDKNYPSFL